MQLEIIINCECFGWQLNELSTKELFPSQYKNKYKKTNKMQRQCITGDLIVR